VNDEQLQRVWSVLIEAERRDDGTWAAWSPTHAWSVTADTEAEARNRALSRAINAGEDPDELIRAAAAEEPPIELEPDDPRIGWLWRFTPQAERLSDGTWRAWFPSGGWTVTGTTEDEALQTANREWFRRRRDPDEVARRVALMRRHLVEPVPGVQNSPSSVLQSAWDSDNPGNAIRAILDQLDPPRRN
jgi:hypothetical protein